MTTMWMH